MKNPFFIILLVASTTLLAAPPAGSADSLFDVRSAQKPSLEIRGILGPKSSDIRYDKRMIHAAQLAAERAHKHSTSRCWHSVKDALVAAQVISSRPTTVYAKQAAAELQQKYGFTKLGVQNPFEAPIGSVLVYGGAGAGHVELRTWQGFASDFISATPSSRPLIGVYVKRS